MSDKMSDDEFEREFPNKVYSAELSEPADAYSPARLVVPFESTWESPAGHRCVGWNFLGEDGKPRFEIFAFRRAEAA